jgi:hypothetical protein
METKSVLDAGMAVDLEVNVRETKYAFICRRQNAEQNQNIDPLKMWQSSDIWG